MAQGEYGRLKRDVTHFKTFQFIVFNIICMYMYVIALYTKVDMQLTSWNVISSGSHVHSFWFACPFS